MEVTLEQDIPEFRFTIDRERAVDAGVMTATLLSALSGLLWADRQFPPMKMRMVTPLTSA